MRQKLFAVVVLMFVAVVAAAQSAARVDEEAYPGKVVVMCPHPIVRDIRGEASAPTQDPTDLPASEIPLTHGSVWNQTAADKAFAHTFHFSLDNKCCIWTKGTLTIEVKALLSGPSTATSVNDGVTVYSNKTVVPPQVAPWTTSVIAGATKTLTFNIPASALALGKVSFYVEDDTAVVWAHLHLEGCCIR